MLTSSIAVSAGLDVNRVEDAALAAGEAFELLAAVDGVESIGCTTVAEGGSVDVALSTHPDLPELPVESWSSSLTGRVLRSLTDDLEYAAPDAAIRFRIDAPHPEGGRADR